MRTLIRVENLTKVYQLYHKVYEKYMDFFLPMKFGDSFYAIRDVTFSVKEGESLALIGLNGSGKSTLANLIAGFSRPTSGTVKTSGTISMLSISMGINPKLTGLENIEFKCLMLGLSKTQIKSLIPKIVEFSELEQFVDQPVKTYSSGMRAKLGFAISVNIDPNILIIDEALSVGDNTFTNKCLEKMMEFRKKGKTIIFVSHSIQQVKDFCNRAIWLECGKIKMSGDSNEVCDAYSQFIKEFNNMEESTRKTLLTDMHNSQFESRRKNGK